MLDYSTPLQTKGRIDDRMNALDAHRLAVEARAGSSHTRSLAANVKGVAQSGWAFAARLRHLRAHPAPTLAVRPHHG